MMRPTITLNGTAMVTHIELRTEAMNAARVLRSCIGDLAPHARDYFCQEQWEIDKALHRSRMQMLQDLEDELLLEALNIGEKA